MDNEKPKSNLLPLLLVGALLMAGVLLRPRRPAKLENIPPLPQLMAQGWINSEGPPDVAGKVVVLDAWFSTCGPCMRAMPHLAEVHREWGGNPGVQFIGLTPEPESKRAQVQGAVDRIAGFDWPVGYGAVPTLDALGVSSYPTLFVFDKTGAAVGTRHNSMQELRDTLEDLL